MDRNRCTCLSKTDLTPDFRGLGSTKLGFNVEMDLKTTELSIAQCKSSTRLSMLEEFLRASVDRPSLIYVHSVSSMLSEEQSRVIESLSSAPKTYYHKCPVSTSLMGEFP